MLISNRHLAIVLAAALLACGLSGCGTINQNLAAGVSDAIPHWAGGMPADAPPRPGTAKYDEFMRERERKRLEPKAPSGCCGKIQRVAGPRTLGSEWPSMNAKAEPAKSLILGATGLVGGLIVEHLVRAGRASAGAVAIAAIHDPASIGFAAIWRNRTP